MDIAQLSQHTEILPWQQPIWQKLQHRFPHLGHGVLFYGKQGCGKQQFASQWIKWLLCHDKSSGLACGHCQHCKWIAAGTHPQVKHIEAEFDEKKQSYSAIKIDQIRDIADFVQQKVEGWRIVVIYPAEKLNIAAANALLKTLEEPGERVIMILISDAILRLPATIRSRVQQFALDRITPQQALLYLQSHDIKITKEVQVALSLAEEMPLKAQAILQTEWFAQRQPFLTQLIELVTKKNAPVKFATKWSKQLDLQDIVQILRYIIQDCIAYKLAQSLKQTDLAIADLANHYTLQQLFDLVEKINQIQQLQHQNVQAQFILDDLMIQCMNV